MMRNAIEWLEDGIEWSKMKSDKMEILLENFDFDFFLFSKTYFFSTFLWFFKL